MARVSEHTLSRARAGDEHAFRELTDPHRHELQLHCYRIVGSAQDAEDLLQETLLAAWRGLDRFQERASLRAWLYRIATNRALDALRASRRRPEDRQRMTEAPAPTRRAEPVWLEPYPDALLEGIPDDAPGPDARYETKEAVALTFIAGLQHLPPQQRVVFVLRDVLGFRAAEVAEMLRTSEPSVNSLLRRARNAFETRLPTTDPERTPLPSSDRERHLVGRLAEAFEAGDSDEVVALLTDDAWLTDAARALRVPGARRDRGLLERSSRAPRHAAAARADPRQRPASGRLLPTIPTDRACATVRTPCPRARARPDLGDDLVRRQQPLLVVRTAAHAALARRPKRRPTGAYQPNRCRRPDGEQTSGPGRLSGGGGVIERRR